MSQLVRVGLSCFLKLPSLEIGGSEVNVLGGFFFILSKVLCLFPHSLSMSLSGDVHSCSDVLELVPD